MRYLLQVRCICVFLAALGWAQMQGCVPARTSGGTEAIPVEVLQSERLRLEKNPVVADSVYVSLRDASGKVFGLRRLMEERLRSLGYTVTENPSRAGYILQLHIVEAGKADPGVVRAAVAAGYDAKVPHGGDGACVLAADVLVALRKSPKIPGRQSHVIKSTSVRTTVGHHPLRMAALSDTPRCAFQDTLPQLEEGIVGAIAAVLPPLRAER